MKWVTFEELQAAELVRARAQHNRYNSAHEAYAVILEELDEFWEQVRMRKKDRSAGVMLTELVQVAVTAQRAAEDLGLLRLIPAPDVQPG